MESHFCPGSPSQPWLRSRVFLPFPLSRTNSGYGPFFLCPHEISWRKPQVDTIRRGGAWWLASYYVGRLFRFLDLGTLVITLLLVLAGAFLCLLNLLSPDCRLFKVLEDRVLLSCGLRHDLQGRRGCLLAAGNPDMDAQNPPPVGTYDWGGSFHFRKTKSLPISCTIKGFGRDPSGPAVIASSLERPESGGRVLSFGSRRSETSPQFPGRTQRSGIISMALDVC